MNLTHINELFVPRIVPHKVMGKLNHKIVLKKDHKRIDGTCAVYLQFYQDGKRKKIPLGISVKPIHFDAVAQNVKRGHTHYEDHKLIIGKVKSDINRILINYRLCNQLPSIEAVIEELMQPGLRINYNEFALKLLLDKKQLLKDSTFRQQKGALAKIKKFQDPILFSEIDEDFLERLKRYCKNKLKNADATVQSTVKNFKKYLHLANDHGIDTKLRFDDIKVTQMIGKRTFLIQEEIKLLHEYFNSNFINPLHRKILRMYLFACFTGIRLSDIEAISEQNFVGDHLALTMAKTDKFIRIKLNKTAKSLVTLPKVFGEPISREHINRELKVIAKVLGIKKRLYFHSSRHTFATNFLIQGGDVVNLRSLLGHSDIKETMIYVHIVESITDGQIDLLDGIIE